MTYYRTRFGVIVTSGPPDRNGYVATKSVLTGRQHGRFRLSSLQPATALEIARAETECQQLATSPEPRHADSEMARARTAARRRLGMQP